MKWSRRDPKKSTAHRLAYKRWYSMMARCYDQAHHKFDRYGGRGIRVAGEWHDFARYYADTGDRPFDGATLDRPDNDGHYGPGNWRWATAEEQNRNRKSTREPGTVGKKPGVRNGVRAASAKTRILDADGNDLTIHEAAGWLGCKPDTLKKRLGEMRQRAGGDLPSVNIDALKATSRQVHHRI